MRKSQIRRSPGGSAQERSGFFPVARWLSTSQYGPQGRRFTRYEALLYLLQFARWNPKVLPFNSRKYEVGVGEIVTSLRELAAAWGWAKSSVADFLRELKNEGLIKMENLGHRATRITLSDALSCRNPPDSDPDTARTLPGQRMPQQTHCQPVREPQDRKTEKKEEVVVATTIEILSTLPGWRPRPEHDRAFILELQRDFPAVDLIDEAKGYRAYVRGANPRKRRWNHFNGFRNRVKKAVQFAAEREAKKRDIDRTITGGDPL